MGHPSRYLGLAIPRQHQNSCSLPGWGSASQQAMAQVVVRAEVGGVGTRRAEELVPSLDIEWISPALLSEQPEGWARW